MLLRGDGKGAIPLAKGYRFQSLAGMTGIAV